MSGQRSPYSRASILLYGPYWLRKGLHWAGLQPGAVVAGWDEAAPVDLTPITAAPAQLIAEPGAFTINGQAASLQRGFTIPAASGSVSVVGSSATLRLGVSLPAASGAVVINGTAAGLNKTFNLAASSGAFTINGTPATLERAFFINVDSGSVTISGQSASLNRNRAIAAASGNVLIAGTPVAFKVDYEIKATSGAWTINGTDAEFRVGHTINASPGAVTINGQAADLEAGRIIAADSTAWVINGQSASLNYGYVIKPGSGSVAINGTAATFRRTYVEPVQPGAFAITGQPATLTLGGRLEADPGSVVIAGQAATLEKGQFIAANPGAVAIAGTAADLLVGKGVAADPGSVVITGQPVVFHWQRVLGAGSGAFLINGTAAALIKNTVEPLAPGAFFINGTAATLRKDSSINAAPGAVTITGTPATLNYGLTFYVDPGSVIINGTPAVLGLRLYAGSGSVFINGTSASLRYGKTLAADPGAVTITGTAASLLVGKGLSAAPGAVTITGTDATLFVTNVTNPVLPASPGSVIIAAPQQATLYKGYKAYSMGSQLKNIISFVNVPPGASATEPHKLQVNGIPVPPDVVYTSAASFTIAANTTIVTVTNNDVVPRSTEILVEHWHTIERAFGSTNITALVPQPVIINPAGTFLGAAQEGNTVVVDQVFGNDATGQRQQRPFATVAAGLAAALPGDVVQIRPGVYNTPAGVVVPANVAVLGGPGTVLRSLNATAPTTLVTLNDGSSIEGLRLILTSTQHVNLIGVDFQGLSAATARVVSTRIEIDNSGAGIGASSVYGIRSSGSGVSTTRNLENVSISVSSPLAGNKRAIYIDGPSWITGFNVTATTLTAGIGIETANFNAVFMGHSVIADGVEADVSQSLGSLILDNASELLNANANGLGFTVLNNPSSQIWSDPGALAANGTFYLRPGTDTASVSPIPVRMPSAVVVKGVSAQVSSPPGGSLTVTVEKNGVATPLAVTLAGAVAQNDSAAFSVGFLAGDEISVRLDLVGNAATDLVVVLELF